MKKLHMKHKPIATFTLAIVAMGTIIASTLMGNVGAAGNASLSLSPGSSSTVKDSQLTVAINMSSTEPVNAIQVGLTYDSSKLQYVSTSATNSAFNAEAVPTEGGNGSVNITRYISGGSTVSGTGKLVAGVTFKALASSGSSPITFNTSNTHISSANTNSEIWDGIQTGGTYSFTSPPATPTPTTGNSSGSGGGSGSSSASGSTSSGGTTKPSSGSSSSSSKPAASNKTAQATTNSTQDAAAPAIASSGYIVAIKVTTSSSSPIAGATVKLDNSSQSTDTTGIASFVGVSAGKHKVTVSGPAGKASKDISVSSSVSPTDVQRFDISVKKPFDFAKLIPIVGGVVGLAVIGFVGFKLIQKFRGPWAGGGSGGYQPITPATDPQTPSSDKPLSAPTVTLPPSQPAPESSAVSVGSLIEPKRAPSPAVAPAATPAPTPNIVNASPVEVIQPTTKTPA